MSVGVITLTNRQSVSNANGPLRGPLKKERVNGSKGQGWRRAARTQRNPELLFRNTGSNLNRFEERRTLATYQKAPPRTTRGDPPSRWSAE